MTDARIESLCLISGAEKPGESVGTTKPRTPSSVCAHTIATSAIEPLVIHILAPSSTQSACSPAPSRRARVRMPPGSEPWSGSVSPKQPMASPAAIRGSHSLLLLLGAEAVDRVHGQAALHRHHRAHAGVARLDLQAGHAVGRRVQAGTAVALEVHAEHAELAELLGQLAGRQRARPRTTRRRAAGPARRPSSPRPPGCRARPGSAGRTARAAPAARCGQASRLDGPTRASRPRRTAGQSSAVIENSTESRIVPSARRW